MSHGKSASSLDDKAIIISFSTAIETHCGLSGIRPCDRDLLRDNDQRQPHKLSYAHDCCNGHYFNSRHHLCCRGRVIFKRSGHYCCGSTTYNPKLELCCNGAVKTKTGSLNACCRSVPYDNSRKICCSGNVVPRPSAGQLSGCCG